MIPFSSYFSFPNMPLEKKTLCKHQRKYFWVSSALSFPFISIVPSFLLKLKLIYFVLIQFISLQLCCTVLLFQIIHFSVSFSFLIHSYKSSFSFLLIVSFFIGHSFTLLYFQHFKSSIYFRIIASSVRLLPVHYHFHINIVPSFGYQAFFQIFAAKFQLFFQVLHIFHLILNFFYLEISLQTSKKN